MRAPVSLATLVVWLAVAPAFAKDRDRDEFDVPQAPQRNPEADQARADADHAYQRGDYRRVVELADLLLSRYATDNPHVAYHLRASARVELGRQARSANQIREGISDARQAILLAGQQFAWLYVPYLYGLTSLADLEKRPEHAELAIRAAGQVLQRPAGVDFSPQDRANLFYQRALAHAARGDSKSALADHAEAVRQSPQHLGAHLQRAALLASQGLTKEALAAYDDAVRRFPGMAIVHNDRGNCRRTAGNLDGAISDFTRALQLDARFAVGYVNRGLSVFDQNNPRAAEADFTEALKLPLDPGLRILALRMRAVARVSRGNADAALTDYAAALKLAPEEATLFEERGCAQFFKKDFAAAAADFGKALQLNPQLTRIVPWQALALARSGKSAESRAALTAATSGKTPPHAWIAKILDYLADRATDDELLAAAAELDPIAGKEQRQCEARFFIGQKKLLAGETGAAADQFREVLATKAFSVAAFRGARYELGNFAGS